MLKLFGSFEQGALANGHQSGVGKICFFCIFFFSFLFLFAFMTLPASGLLKLDHLGGFHEVLFGFQNKLN